MSPPAVLLTGVGKRYDIVACFAHLTTTIVADPSPLAPARHAAQVRASVPLIDDPEYVRAFVVDYVLPGVTRNVNPFASAAAGEGASQ